jgi:hypothetical protein
MGISCSCDAASFDDDFLIASSLSRDPARCLARHPRSFALAFDDF